MIYSGGGERSRKLEDGEKGGDERRERKRETETEREETMSERRARSTFFPPKWSITLSDVKAFQSWLKEKVKS